MDATEFIRELKRRSEERGRSNICVGCAKYNRSCLFGRSTCAVACYYFETALEGGVKRVTSSVRH